jgi:hypothetical protein
VDPKGKVVHFFDEADLRALLPPDRFDLITLEEVDLAEVPDELLLLLRFLRSLKRR